MDILVPWLAATIEAELGEVLQNWGGAIRHQFIDKSSNDDCTILRIPSTKKGPVVQIIKFLTYEDPVQVTLSDTIVRINASIANQASKEYAKKNKKKVTDGTVGGLIQLQDFEIVVRCNGRRDRLFTLSVANFKSLDSIKSGTFGCAPQAIEGREEIKELLPKLAALHGQESDARSEQSAAPSPIKSQLSTQTSEPANDQDSPSGFATQLTRSINPSNSKPNTSRSNNHLNTNAALGAISAKALAPPTDAKYEDLVASISGLAQAKAAPQKKTSSSKEALLGLLNNNKRATLTPDIFPQPMIEDLSGVNVASTEPIGMEKEGGASRENAFAQNLGHAGRAPGKIQKRKRRSPDSTPRKKPADDHSSYVVGNGRDSSTVYHDLGNRVGSGISLAKDSVDLLLIQPNDPSASASKKPIPQASRDRSVSSTVKHNSSSFAHNAGRSRISSRDVGIPKDQDILLSRADSWLPAEPGQREPSANIPISTLKNLNLKASLRAQRLARTQENMTVVASALPDSSAESDEDEPVSLGQWPPSPERDQLPPDSSPNSEHSDHSVKSPRTNLSLVSSARKQSRASISSQSNSSRRQSPVSARYFSRESVSPSMASSGPFSPAGTPNSAGKGIRQLRWQGPGYEKSFKPSSGLEYYVNHHSSSLGLVDDIECIVKDRTKLHTRPPSPKNHPECGNAGPLREKANANSTTSHESPSFVGLKPSSSENDKDFGQKFDASRVGDESNNVDVSAPKLPLIGRGSTSPGNRGKFQSSSTGFLDGNHLQPHEAPALVQPGEGLDKGVVSPLLPPSPTSDSDLEIIAPLALKERTDSVASSAPMQRDHSNASQPQDPFTQVQRTPYVNGRVHIESLASSGTLSTPMKSKSYSLPNGNKNDDTEFVSASFTSCLESSTAEANGENGSFHRSGDHGNGKLTAMLMDESNNQGKTDRISKEPEALATEVQLEPSGAELPAVQIADPSFVLSEQLGQSSGLNQPAIVAEASIRNRAMSEKSLTLEVEHTNSQCRSPESENCARRAEWPKRKVADASFMFPEVAKRQKKFRTQPSFTINERSDVRRDPAEGARQYRQDYLASRRSSESSTPTMSPTKSINSLTDIMSEIPRDPAERARHFRQETLASIRSIEINTPTVSPTKQLNSTTEAIRAKYRTAEVVKDVEQVKVHNQSADSQTQHERMDESTESAAETQPNESKLDASPLTNRITDMGPAGDREKPVMQENLSSDYQAGSPVFVVQGVQDADVDSHQGMQGTAVETSFPAPIDAEQQAQSLEVGVNAHPPHHWESRDGVASVEDGVNQTANSSLDIQSANRDRVANGTEEGQFVDADLVEAREASQAREVAEQGTNVHAKETRIDDVTQLETVTVKSPGKDLLIAEGLDAQTRDQPSLEPKIQQQSVTMDADAPRLDEITAEPTLHHQQVGEITALPMPVVQISHGITSPKCNDPADDPKNKSATLPSVVPALVAEPNTENQLCSSPTDLNTAMLQRHPVPNPDIQAAPKHQETEPFPIKINKQNSLSQPQSIFEEFKATYPSYPGDKKHFVSVCRKISQLVKANKMEHPSLWDDFIVRHKTDYAQYLRRCAEEAEDAIPYELFYRTEVERPRYEQRVINRRSLETALSLALEQPSLELLHHGPTGDDGCGIGPVDGVSTVKSYLAVDIPETTRIKSPLKPVASSSIIQKPPGLPVVIDLTQDDSPEDLAKTLNQNETPNQHRSPLPVNGVLNQSPSVQSYRGSSGSPYQALNTSTALQSSHVVSPPKSTRTSVVPATASSRRSNKSVRQSLPRNSSDQSTLQTSLDTNANDSSHRLPKSQSRTDAAVENPNEDGSAKWWEDENSPFKSFFRAYASIQPGKGNSFAEAGPANRDHSRRVDNSASTGVELGRINIMRWDL